MNCIFKIQSLLAASILFQCSLNEAMGVCFKSKVKPYFESLRAPSPSSDQEIYKVSNEFVTTYYTTIRQRDGLYIRISKDKKTSKKYVEIFDYQKYISIPKDEEKKLYNQLKRLYKSQQVQKNIQIQSNQFNFPKIEEVD